MLKEALHRVNRRREKHSSDLCFIPPNLPFFSIRDQLEFGSASPPSLFAYSEVSPVSGSGRNLSPFGVKLSEPQTSLPRRDDGAAVNLTDAIHTIALEQDRAHTMQCEKENFSLAMTSP